MSAIVVTGANGFIGAGTLRALRAMTPAPTVVRAGRDGATSDWPLDLAAQQLTLPDGANMVLHLAGEKRDPARMNAVNHVGAVRLVDAAARSGAKRFILLSSVGVYGAPKHAGLVDESFGHTPHGTYELSKHLGETAVRARCDDVGLPCIVLQPSNVVGVVPGRSYPLLGLAKMVARGWYREVGSADAWVNYVALEDVAAAICAVLRDEARPGVYIVNTPSSLRTLIGWIAEELMVPAPKKKIPLWLGAAAATAGALGRAFFRRNFPLSPERFRELTNTTRYDGSALCRSLGFTYPMGIERAIRAMVRDYRNLGLL